MERRAIGRDALNHPHIAIGFCHVETRKLRSMPPHQRMPYTSKRLAMRRCFCGMHLSIMLGLVSWVSTVNLGWANTNVEQLAFPGASGFGRLARGGRGGDVYHVTTLDDDGPGSLREGIRSAMGPRTIVFDISGTITLKSRLVVDTSYLTIAGQSATGDGICLRDHNFRIENAAHVIIRYLRLRLGDENKARGGVDCMTTEDIDHVILDHITASWGIDGVHDLRRGGNVTVQWSIYAEALHDSIHEKGPHAMLGSFREVQGGVSLHHNLFASSRDRHPTLGGSPDTDPNAVVDFRNNVLYNVEGATNLGNCKINVINNYFRPGPNTPANHQPLALKAETVGATKVYLTGNLFEGSEEYSECNYRAIDFDRWSKGNYVPTNLASIRADSEFALRVDRPPTQSASDAYESVLRSAGASRRRDGADKRLVQGVRDRSHRMIDSQSEVGGWPHLRSQTPPIDTDGDGMPDEWESEHGFDPADRRDGSDDRNMDGYSNLEEYLNSLVDVPG
jgi:pectate lyase